MADTARTKDALLALTTRKITPQDLRDLIVSIWSYFDGTVPFARGIQAKGNSLDDLFRLIDELTNDVLLVGPKGRIEHTPRSQFSDRTAGVFFNSLVAVASWTYNGLLSTIAKVTGVRFGQCQLKSQTAITVDEAYGIELPEAPLAGTNVTITRSSSALIPGRAHIRDGIELTVQGSLPSGLPPAARCRVFAYNDSGTHKLVVQSSSGALTVLATLT